MIFAEPTKFRAGITLYGDYMDFRSLHSTVHELADRSPLAGHFEEFILRFAYELRHAYQGDREEKEFGDVGIDYVKYFGVPILWPLHLVFVGLLRWAAAFNPTTKEMQANLFRLETATENALLRADSKIGMECVDWLSSFQGYANDYLLEFVDDCCLQYITATGRERFKSLPRILRKLSLFSMEYDDFRKQLEQIARFQKCRPEDLSNKVEWPEFRW